MPDESKLRSEMVRICVRLSDRGLIAASDGNVSCRIGPDRLLVTPSGRPKGGLAPSDLLVVNLDGELVSGAGRPSSELKMHLAVYHKRADVNALVHAHPPLLTAFTLAGVAFASDVLPEVWLTIGPVPTAPYATPSTREVPDSIEPFIADHRAILLERHGALTFGGTMEEACMRLEKLEHAAHTLYYAVMIARRPPDALAKEDLEKLEEVRRAMAR